MTHDEKRTERLELVLTPSEREALVVAADQLRRTHASIVREALEDWHARHTDRGEAR